MVVDFSWLRRGLKRPRRYPDPCEDEYRAGWLWGLLCGVVATSTVVVTALVVIGVLK